MKELQTFLEFQVAKFFADKRLVWVKSVPWYEDGQELGSRVTVQIIEDNTAYSKQDSDNFGEQIVVKMRGIVPAAFSKLKPLSTEVVITDVERAVVFGEYREKLSMIAKVAVKDAH